MAPGYHRAATVEKPGAALVTTNVETPSIESIQSFELIVRNEAIGINPVDALQKNTGTFVKVWPHIVGVDSAGVVEAVGRDVKDRRVGQRVLCSASSFRGAKYGAYQEKVVIWSDCTVPIPDAMSFAEAATFSCTFTLAAVLLGLNIGLPIFQASSPPSALDTPIAVLGGASSVGQFAIQILAHHGYTNIITTCSPSNYDFVKGLGAKVAIDYHDVDVAERIEKAANGKVPIVVLTTGSFDTVAKIVKPKTGKIASSMGWNGADQVTLPEGVEKPAFPMSGWYYDRDTSSAPGNGQHPDWWEFGRRGDAFLEKALAAGTFHGHRTQELSVSNAGGGDLAKALSEAMEVQAKGVSARKVVVTLD